LFSFCSFFPAFCKPQKKHTTHGGTAPPPRTSLLLFVLFSPPHAWGGVGGGVLGFKI